MIKLSQSDHVANNFFYKFHNNKTLQDGGPAYTDFNLQVR